MKRVVLKYLIPPLLGLVAGGLFFLVSHSGAFDNFRFRLTDRFFTQPWATNDIIVVEVDPKTLRGLGKFQEWSRREFPKALVNLARMQPKAVGIDFVFQGRSKGISEQDLLKKKTNGLPAKEVEAYLALPHPDDQALANALKLLPQSVLIRFIDPANEENTFESLSTIHDAAGAHGWNNTFPDQDGILRRYPVGFQYKGAWTPSFAYAMADMAQKAPKKEEIPTDENSAMFINFSAKNEPFERVSFVDLANGIAPTEKFRNKIVFIGPTDPTFHDNVRVAVTRDEKLMAGVKIHAAATHTLIAKNFLALQTPKESALLFTIGGAILGFILGMLPFWLSTVLAVLSLPGTYVLGKWFFKNGTIIDLFALLIAVVAAYLFVLIYRFATERRRRKKVQHLFGHYVSKDLVRELMQKPGDIKLGGERREITLLFSDIQGSTALGEKLSPESLVLLMNLYFTAMTKAIMNAGGTLDKFEGDGIMAFFGAPIPQKDHPDRALKAALAMQEALKQVNHELLETSERSERAGVGLVGPTPSPIKNILRMRIGIHTGKAIVGNMGSPERVNYTAMGDAVNVAARLQEFNKELNTELLFSAETRDILSEKFEKALPSGILSQPLGKKAIRGREQPIELFTFAKTV